MDPSVVWVGWLALFLIYEVTAALRERGTAQRLTLSRNVWKWFDRRGEKLALAVFMLTLTAHLVLGTPGAAAVILTGAPVALVIALEVVRRRPAVALMLALPLLLGADKCSVSWPQPQPTPTATPAPTPEPTPEPTPAPTPTPEPTPVPTPTPTPPPVVGWEVCPKEPAEGYRVTINDKRYGNGIDSTIYIEGDPEFCRLIHGVSVNSCHLEGWPLRPACEMKLARGCPTWQYSVNAATVAGECQQADHPVASCDHWGDPAVRDDPKTPEFEGNPKACGNQRDLNGDPKAGYFVIGHGEAYFRACVPSSGACGAWVAGKDKQ